MWGLGVVVWSWEDVNNWKYDRVVVVMVDVMEVSIKGRMILWGVGESVVCKEI